MGRLLLLAVCFSWIAEIGRAQEPDDLALTEASLGEARRYARDELAVSQFNDFTLNEALRADYHGPRSRVGSF